MTEAPGVPDLFHEELARQFPLRNRGSATMISLPPFRLELLALFFRG